MTRTVLNAIVERVLVDVAEKAIMIMSDPMIDYPHVQISVQRNQGALPTLVVVNLDNHDSPVIIMGKVGNAWILKTDDRPGNDVTKLSIDEIAQLVALTMSNTTSKN